MPAVLIRLIDSLGSIMLDTTSPEQRVVLRRQADMVLRLSEETVTEPNDLEEIRFRYRRIPGEDAFEAEAAHLVEDRPALTLRRPLRSGRQRVSAVLRLDQRSAQCCSGVMASPSWRPSRSRVLAVVTLDDEACGAEVGQPLVEHARRHVVTAGPQARAPRLPSRSSQRMRRVQRRPRRSSAAMSGRPVVDPRTGRPGSGGGGGSGSVTVTVTVMASWGRGRGCSESETFQLG